jgi:hypothetical protein
MLRLIIPVSHSESWKESRVSCVVSDGAEDD